jgi:hypothetical protein
VRAVSFRRFVMSGRDCACCSAVPWLV